MKLLNEEFDLTWNTASRNLSQEEIIKAAHGREGLITLLSNNIDRHLIDQLSSVRIISNYAVGYNNINVNHCRKKSIVVTNTPGVLTETSADTAFALMLTAARRVVTADNFIRKGNWKGWYPTEYLGQDVWGSELGIVGMGRIGKAMVERAKGFKMKISYWNRTRLSAEEEQQLGVHYLPLDELIQSVNFLSLHVSYTPETHHLIDAKRLATMRSNSYVINTSRGAVIDENALANALKSKIIAGAGLDVYEKEPIVHPTLLNLEQVVLLPHLGSASMSTREAMGELVVKNLKAFFNNEKIPNAIE